MGLSSILKKRKEPINTLPPTPPLQYQVYSHNIRQDTTNLLPGEKSWRFRRQDVCSSIFHNSKNLPTVVGLQEVKHNQLHDILFSLGSEWTYFGVGRDDGKTNGEFCPILFKTAEWDFISGKTVWLSQDHEHPNKGWDSACYRIVTIVDLKHKSGKQIRVLNTHFDHKGSVARSNSSKLLLKLTEGSFTILGDFNSERHEEAYKILSKRGLNESSNAKVKLGFEFTDTGFNRGTEKLIDFIWSNNEILQHKVLTNKSQDDSLFSDHRPVVAIINVP